MRKKLKLLPLVLIQPKIKRMKYCPHCHEALEERELKYKYCYKCNNKFIINIHGEPLILIVPKTSRDEYLDSKSKQDKA